MPYRKVHIRPYREKDEPLLFELARRAFCERGGWSDRRTLAVLERETVFVAEGDSEPAGYVALEARGDAVRVDQLLVSPAYEGQGVGHQLLAWAEGYAISQRARSLEIVVEPDNRPALDFYRRYGFAPGAGDASLLELVLPHG